ncbi:hypothetical protein IT570_00315 [Candidatus Sumerlaeota bacterium]|nr:hypothetical protein [Candidatus Sumerlaeota bacterium]
MGVPMGDRAQTTIRLDRAHLLLGIVMIPLVATCGMAYARAAVPQAATGEQRVVLVERDRRDASAEMLADSDGQQEAVRRQTHFLPPYAVHATRSAVVWLNSSGQLDFPPCNHTPLHSRAPSRVADVRGPPHEG